MLFLDPIVFDRWLKDAVFLDRYWDIGLDLIRDGIIELDIIMGIFLINMKEGNSDARM